MRNPDETVENLPATLSAAGAFADLATMTPHAGVLPYRINVPFWSDDAIKTRWFSVPARPRPDLANVRTYIANDSPRYASIVIVRLLNATVAPASAAHRRSVERQRKEHVDSQQR